MKISKLKKLINIHNGTKYTHLDKGNIPLYGSGGLMSYVNDYLYDGEAILLPRKGTLNNIMFTNGKIWTVDTMYYATVKENINTYYLYLYLKLLNLERLDSGSTLPSMTKDSYGNIEISLFEYNLQKKIAYFFKTLDSKIELNNKINLELEKMAKTLYDYWFVQFDFPDENGKPYKSSGGKMVYSKKLKREIPEGWGVKKMNQLLIKNSEKFNINGEKHSIDTIDLSVMPSGTMCITNKNNSDEFGTNLFKMNKFDILFGGIRPYLLKAGFAPFDGLVTGTVLSYSIKNEFEYNFSLLTITHESMFNFAVVNSKGTKMPVIGTDDLLSYKVPYNKDIINKFDEIISFKEIISKNILENQKLEELRDWLLPMLMNRQVEVV